MISVSYCYIFLLLLNIILLLLNNNKIFFHILNIPLNILFTISLYFIFIFFSLAKKKL